MADRVERRYLTTAQLLAQPFKPREKVDMSEEARRKRIAEAAARSEESSQGKIKFKNEQVPV